MSQFKLLLLISICISLIANANGDINSLQKKRKLETEVMVLGSPHLNIVKKPLGEKALNSVVQPLKAFHPTAVAIESLRSQDILAMLSGSSEYKPVLEQFVGTNLITLAQKEQKSLKLTASGAIGKLNQQLNNSKLSVGQRVEAVQLAIAAYDFNTALLHWTYLDKTAPVEAISEDLKQALKTLSSRNNEIAKLAIPLALELNLNRLYPIDSHRDKDVYNQIIQPLLSSYQNSQYAKQLAKSEYFNKPKRMIAKAEQSENWLPIYSWFNSKDYTSKVINEEWSMFVDKDLDTKPALARVALWEVRNLDMVSNIMRVVSEHTGERIIIIVGANHKVFFEQYLSQMIGVKVVQFSDYL